jgi:acyl-CoA thioesterase II
MPRGSTGPRADTWLLQDVQSLVNAGGRGTLRGVIRSTDGKIVASMAQEMLLQPVPEIDPS